MFLIQLIVVLTVIFGLLIFALRQILTKNISHATSHLDELNADFIRREEEIKRRQAESEQFHSETIAKAQAEADRIRQEADRQAQEEKERLLAEARAQSEEIVVKAEKTKGVISDELRRTVEARMSVRMGECFVAILPPRAREELHRLWVDDLLSGSLGDFSTMRIPEGVSAVRVVSAYPLSASHTAALEKKFRDTFKRDFTFRQEVDAVLVGGVLFEIGSLVLDGTIRNRIQQVIHESV